MRQFLTEGFNKGIYNLLDAENIPTSASQDSLNWRSLEDRVEFTGGKRTLGTTATVTTPDGVRGSFYVSVDYSDLYSNSTFTNIQQNFGFLKVVGKKLYFWKDDTNSNSGTWIAIPIVGTATTDLFRDDETVFIRRGSNEYQSLAGRFIYIVGSKSNIYKLDPYALNNPTLAFVTRCYVPANNFLGSFFFDKSRNILTKREQDATGDYLSKIDPQGANYTTVTAETHAFAGGIVNVRLTAAAADEKRHVFGLVLTVNGVTYRDDKKGGFVNIATGNRIPRFDPLLVGAAPIGATIVYNTGQLLISTSPAVVGNASVDYQWEDPTVDGVWDFRFSIPRLTGEGDIVRQDAGADPILAQIPYKGVYYSIKNSASYQLTLDSVGDVATNTVFARNLGIPSSNAIVATDIGIIYIDTSDVKFPRLKILKNLEFGGVIEPVEIAKHFRFADFNYENAFFEIYNNNILIACKTLQSANDGYANDRILFYDLRNDAVSVYGFGAANIVADGSRLFVGDPATEDVSTLFEIYSNNGMQVLNYWVGKDEKYSKELLKKLKWLRVKGRISIDTEIRVFANYDDAGFQWVGTILGNGTYVDQFGNYTIGSTLVGAGAIGGEDPIMNSLQGNPYFCELKLYSPKFRIRSLLFEVVGFGYASIDLINDFKIQFYEERMPQKYRSKQNVSLPGVPNQPLPHYSS